MSFSERLDLLETKIILQSIRGVSQLKNEDIINSFNTLSLLKKDLQNQLRTAPKKN